METDKIIEMFGKLNYLGCTDGLEGDLIIRVRELTDEEFEDLADELSKTYERVRYNFEVAEGLNIKIVMD